MLRQALRALLEQRGLEVVADEADGRAAVDAVQRHAPDVAVLDVAMPVLNGVDAAREIARVAPGCPVILLSGVDDARLREGRLYVSPGASQAIVDGLATPASDGSRLTPRERQVLQLVGEGKSTKQIAEVLHISVKTAEFHRGRLMKKLNVHDTANLVRYAIREGWIVL